MIEILLARKPDNNNTYILPTSLKMAFRILRLVTRNSIGLGERFTLMTSASVSGPNKFALNENVSFLVAVTRPEEFMFPFKGFIVKVRGLLMLFLLENTTIFSAF